MISSGHRRRPAAHARSAQVVSAPRRRHRRCV